jgi:hypothetical protein
MKVSNHEWPNVPHERHKQGIKHEWACVVDEMQPEWERSRMHFANDAGNSVPRACGGAVVYWRWF